MFIMGWHLIEANRLFINSNPLKIKYKIAKDRLYKASYKRGRAGRLRVSYR